MGKKTKSKFKGKVSSDAQRQKTKGSQYGHLQLPKGVRVFKEPTHGRIYLDFLPYKVTEAKHPDRDNEREIAVPGELWYKRPYKVHRNIGSNNETVICRGSIGAKCPICEHRSHLLQEGADYQDESVKALRASNRNLYVVIPRDNKEYEEEPHIWDISQFLFQDELNDELEENEEFGAFPDPEEGLTVSVRFKENQLGKNKFGKASSITFSDRDEQPSDEVLKKVPNLDEVLDIPTYQTAEAKFLEIEEEQPAGEEEERKPKHTTQKEEKEEAKEEESTKEAEAEEEKKPKKMGRTKKQSSESKSKCPHGHTFGTDCEEHDECDDCDKFEECLDVKEGVD